MRSAVEQHKGTRRGQPTALCSEFCSIGKVRKQIPKNEAKMSLRARHLYERGERTTENE